MNKDKTFRNFIATSYDVEDVQDYLSAAFDCLKLDYVCGQQEMCPSTGRLHVQWFGFKSSKLRFAALKKFDETAHYEQARDQAAAIEYCQKEETRCGETFKQGICPVRRNNKTDWERVKKLIIAGKFDEIPADILIRYYRQIKEINRDFNNKVFEKLPSVL